jgi:hypothetical protein
MLILLITLIIGFSAFAKSDYKNPVESEKIYTMAIYPTPNSKVERELFICTDKYENYYLNINVNYFVKKGKDKLEITLTNDSTYTLKLGESFKQLAYTFYSEHSEIRANTTVSRIGNTTFVNTTVGEYRQKYNYHNFYSAYPISIELYELIKEIGIKEIKVEGIYKIELQ